MSPARLPAPELPTPPPVKCLLVDDLDENLLVSWIEQASNLPGERI